MLPVVGSMVDCKIEILASSHRNIGSPFVIQIVYQDCQDFKRNECEELYIIFIDITRQI